MSRKVSWIVVVVALLLAVAACQTPGQPAGEEEETDVTADEGAEEEGAPPTTAPPEPSPTETPVPTPMGGGSGRIAFDSRRDESAGDIFLMNAECVSPPEGCGSNVVRLTFESGTVSTPAWSPDGSRIAVQATIAGGPNIWVINADGSGLSQVTTNPAMDAHADWSPDGTRIVFDSTLGGPLVTLAPGIQRTAEDIYVVDADGSNVIRLTDNPDRDFDPTWSPDGTRIAFVSRRDDNHDIYVMNAECISLPEGCGSNVVRLTDGPGIDLSPAWSPDGSRIAFRDGDFNISVVNADGSNLVQLTDDPASEGDPAWSPDGSLIAFTSNRNGNNDIFVMNADGTNVIQLTDDPADDARPAWEPILSGAPASPAPSTPGPQPSASGGGELASVETVEIFKSDSDQLQVYAQAKGHLPDFCSKTGDWSQSRDGNTFTITLPIVIEETPGCADSGQVSFGVNIPLGLQGVTPGAYSVSVNGALASFDLTADELARSGTCGDGLCAAGEDAATCPADCQ